jgi:Amidases related to nicotinamidase
VVNHDWIERICAEDGVETEPDYSIARKQALKRRQQPFTLEPQATAIVVVDALNDFFKGRKDGGSLLREIDTMVSATRDAGAYVVWICDRHLPDDPEFVRSGVHCVEGTWGAEIVPELTVEPIDSIVPKRRYSGFFGTTLDLRLRELGVAHLVVVGVATNVCVRSTVHDGFFLGYDITVPPECVAGTSMREQDSSLCDIDLRFGRVRPLKECIDALKQ